MKTELDVSIVTFWQDFLIFSSNWIATLIRRSYGKLIATLALEAVVTPSVVVPSVLGLLLEAGKNPAEDEVLAVPEALSGVPREVDGAPGRSAAGKAEVYPATHSCKSVVSYHQSTGWPFTLFPTSRWHLNKSSILAWGPCIKTQPLFWCQQEFGNNVNGHPV